MIRYSRPTQLQLEELAEAAQLGVTLAMADRIAVLGPTFASSSTMQDPGTTTGIWQEPPPNW